MQVPLWLVLHPAAQQKIYLGDFSISTGLSLIVTSILFDFLLVQLFFFFFLFLFSDKTFKYETSQLFSSPQVLSTDRSGFFCTVEGIILGVSS